MKAPTFDDTYRRLCQAIISASVVHVGQWQSMDVSTSPVHATRELLDMRFAMDVPRSRSELWEMMSRYGNLDWAEEHFAERVGGVPVNPPPSAARWPWGHHNAKHLAEGVFAHTYPERFWPKHAGHDVGNCAIPRRRSDGHDCPCLYGDRRGIRYQYGDLNDVVALLRDQPLTRQAYLPVWLPEDTGGSTRIKARVPCTLGYHFMIRGDMLHMWYHIRSCDLVRHFPDDVFLAGRLLQWMRNRIATAYRENQQTELRPGRLIMNIASLHAFVGDDRQIQRIAGETDD